MPQGFCYNWDPYVIWLNAASDTLIALAYFTIPITLVYFARQRRDLTLPDSEALRGVGLKLDEALQTTRTANEELERRIAEHTASLAAANATLPAEIEEHKRVQAAMQWFGTSTDVNERKAD